MLREKDLPCSDRGTELVERAVEAHELSASSQIDGSIRFAECSECGGRYFPQQSLSKLSTNSSRTEGGE